MATAALTARSPALAASAGKPAATSKGLFKRFFDAMVEARMRAAAHEIARHRHLLAASGIDSPLPPSTDHKLPFVR